MLHMMVKAEEIEISNIEGLQAIAADAYYNNNTYSGTVIKLTADLDLANVSWTPIGTPEAPFNGTFDGGGYTLSNLNVLIDGAMTGNVAGLFGVVGTNGIVQDLHIGGSEGLIYLSDTHSSTCYLGAIAGINNGTIIGCSNMATVSGGSWANARIGGIVGENSASAKIQHCYNLGEVYTSKSFNYIGGVVGNNDHGVVQNCFMRSLVIKGDAQTAYPIYGNNNGGTIAGCFYANGTGTDAPEVGASVFSLADGSDNSSALESHQGSSKNVLLHERTLYTDGDWNTLCLPFDIPSGAQGRSPIAGARVMTLASSSFSAGTLTLVFEDVSGIKAGKPYIVKWDRQMADNLPNPVFMDVTVSNTLSSITTDVVMFEGCFSPVAIDGEDRKMLYLGSNNRVYYPSSTMDINSFRAYFLLWGDLVCGDLNSSAGINAFALTFGDDSETGIALTSHPTDLISDAWYTLDGRKLSSKPTIKGIYINRGKKIVRK